MVDKGPVKSITVEDSFKTCCSMAAAQHVLQVLSPDLLSRMAEDQEVRQRRCCCKRCTEACRAGCPPCLLTLGHEDLEARQLGTSQRCKHGCLLSACSDPWLRIRR